MKYFSGYIEIFLIMLGILIFKRRFISAYRPNSNQRNWNAFAALKQDGSVVCWGDPNGGGDCSSVSSSLTSSVQQIYSAGFAFAALKQDGSVVCWGNLEYGGDCWSVSSSLTSSVQQIYSTGAAFAALKQDGSVVCWGDPDNGGDCSSVSSSLTSNVMMVYGQQSTNALSQYKLSPDLYNEISNGYQNLMSLS